MDVYIFGFTVLLLANAALVANGQASYTTDLETELRTSLFTGYEVLQRPSQTVQITVAMNLITINSLNIKDQVLSTSGYFTMEWTDPRLDWSNNITVSNIKFLFSQQKYMWRPAIVVENSVTSLDVLSNEDWLMRVISTGKAHWTPGGIFETSCDADVTYYPLDTQTCSIVLTTWAYTGNEVALQFSTSPFVQDSFSENGEWELLETSTSSEEASRSPEDANSYSRLYFTLTLKRRPLFHILNTIFPVLMMASLIVFVFKLPPESGERMGMSLTVLLAYAVYLTLISENIPRTSLSASILSTYLTIILLLSTLSVIFTIVVLDIYFNHADDEEPPNWVQTFTRLFLVKMAMWKGERCCKRSKVKPSEATISSSRLKLPLDDLGNDTVIKTRYRNGTAGGVDMKPSEIETGEADDVKIYSWKEVALILDRCFMYLFIGMVVISTVVCFGILMS